MIRTDVVMTEEVGEGEAVRQGKIWGEKVINAFLKGGCPYQIAHWIFEQLFTIPEDERIAYFWELIKEFVHKESVLPIALILKPYWELESLGVEKDADFIVFMDEVVNFINVWVAGIEGKGDLFAEVSIEMLLTELLTHFTSDEEFTDAFDRKEFATIVLAKLLFQSGIFQCICEVRQGKASQEELSKAWEKLGASAWKVQIQFFLPVRTPCMLVKIVQICEKAGLSKKEMALIVSSYQDHPIVPIED